MPNPLSQFFTAAQAAAFLNVTPGRIRQFVVEKRLVPVMKVGVCNIFKRADVKRLKGRKNGRPKGRR